MVYFLGIWSDREDTLLSKVSNLGKVSANDLNKVYLGKVQEDAIFCTDSEKSYRKFARENGFRLIQLESGKHKQGIYHINHINSYHSHLKHFINGFKGVATKYLDNYLTWKNTKGISIENQLKYVSSQTLLLPNRMIKIRPVLQ